MDYRQLKASELRLRSGPSPAILCHQSGRLVSPVLDHRRLGSFAVCSMCCSDGRAALGDYSDEVTAGVDRSRVGPTVRLMQLRLLFLDRLKFER